MLHLPLPFPIVKALGTDLGSLKITLESVYESWGTHVPLGSGRLSTRSYLWWSVSTVFTFGQLQFVAKLLTKLCLIMFSK